MRIVDHVNFITLPCVLRTCLSLGPTASRPSAQPSRSVNMPQRRPKTVPILQGQTTPPLNTTIVSLSAPKHVACMSISEDRAVHTDDYASIAIFTPPPQGANLAVESQFRRHKSRSDRNPHHNHPVRLDRICHMHIESAAWEEMSRAEIVTWRGIMKK